MRRTRNGTVFAVLLLLLSLVGAEPRARACGFINGYLTRVRGEEVLIVWDAARHREHFLRHISFEDAAPDFGFLVPTPSRPELGEVDDGIFNELFYFYSRHRPERHSNSHGAAVQVVEVQRVAGMDATVLAATDAHALDAWLTAHHYASTPALADYLAPYVAQHFFFTVFRYAGGASFSTRAVRMSFDAPEPFFPYAEPTDAPQVAGRIFRVSVVSDRRVEGRVGGRRWAARTRFAGRSDELARAFAHYLPDGALAAHPWLTTFQEDASVRGRDDLVFVPSSDRTPVRGTLESIVGLTTPPAEPDFLDRLLVE